MKRFLVFGVVALAPFVLRCSDSPPGDSPDASTTTDGGPLPDGVAPEDAGPIVAPEPISEDIVVDQFGYRPATEKIAVLRSPQTGFDKNKPYVIAAKYALVDAHSQKRVLEAAPTPWNGGATDPSSGDKASWFDFSSVTTPGDFYVLDETANVRSDVFRISEDVFRKVLDAAVRMFYYQRDGIAKEAKYAGADWVDGPAHMGAGQGPSCTLYGGATVKDVHGGWWDAGDQNKYTNWGAQDVIILLRAFEEHTAAFRDDTNIPESGNGVPDVLDEAKWELDWLVRMQNADGSVASIVGQSSAKDPSQGGSPNTAPSTDTTPCKYGPANTSATFTTASAFAKAALVFRAAGVLASYADDLAQRAEKAWTWALANPSVVFQNGGKLGAGEQEVDANGRAFKKVQAAGLLFELTKNATYKTAFDQGYGATNLIKSGYVDMFAVEEADTLLEYAKLPGATPAVSADILAKFKAALGDDRNLGSLAKNSDPYLGYIYTYVWGSNQTKSDQGNMFTDVVTFGVDPTKNADATRGAERYVHWLHGTNPLSLVYLSNMGALGANKSATRFYHSWFAKGSDWDAVGVSKHPPPPGYLTGGPNPTYDWDGCCPGGCGVTCGSAALSPPKGQPSQKSYLDFNDSWPLDSWSVTEPSDGYQVKYIRLLSKFAN